MTASAAIFAILASLWLGAMIPGPSFVLVARNAIGLSRRDGLATALGMGAGGIFFGSIALAGLYTLLQTVEWLYIGLKIAGGAYLIFVASKIWRGANRPIAMQDAAAAVSSSPRKSFWVGLTTQLSNPKTAIWYGSIFAALLPQHPPLWCYFVLPPLVFSVEFGWYTIVALCFSSKGPREVYLRAKKWID
jgi:threonine/homoserine/homoserine lactone efflux protein